MKELQIIQSKLKAPKSQYNNFGKYNYRSCEDILESLKPLLDEVKCALTISDEIVMIGERIYVKAVATLFSSNGSCISVAGFAREELEKKGMDSSQITGACSSYARKYALNGLFCIDDGKDSDASNKSKVAPDKVKGILTPQHPKWQGCVEHAAKGGLADIKAKYEVSEEVEKLLTKKGE